jgi:hypothetical protein
MLTVHPHPPPPTIQFAVQMRLRRALGAFLKAHPAPAIDNVSANTPAIQEMTELLDAKKASLLLSDCNKVALSSYKCCSHATDLPSSHSDHGAKFWAGCQASANCGWCPNSTATPSSPEAIAIRSAGLSGTQLKFLELLCDDCIIATFGSQVSPDYFYDYVICVCGGWHRLVAPAGQAAELRVTFDPCYHCRPGAIDFESMELPDYSTSLAQSMPSTPSLYPEDPSPTGELDDLPTFSLLGKLASSPPSPVDLSAFDLSLPLHPVQFGPPSDMYINANAGNCNNPKKRKSDAKSPSASPSPKRMKSDTPRVAPRTSSSPSSPPPMSVTTNICSPLPGGEYYAPAPGVVPMCSKMTSRSHLSHPQIFSVRKNRAPYRNSQQQQQQQHAVHGHHHHRPPLPPAPPQLPVPLPIHATHTNLQRVAGANVVTNTVGAQEAHVGLEQYDHNEDDSSDPLWDPVHVINTTTYHTTTIYKTSNLYDPSTYSSPFPNHGE